MVFAIGLEKLSRAVERVRSRSVRQGDGEGRTGPAGRLHMAGSHWTSNVFRGEALDARNSTTVAGGDDVHGRLDVAVSSAAS